MINNASFQETLDKKLDRSLFNVDCFAHSLNRLRTNAGSFHQQYMSGNPYPHLIIDNLFDPEILDRILEEFPTANNRDWYTWDTKHELKTTSKGIDGLSPFTQLFCMWLSTSEVITEIKKITGLDNDNIVADPMYHGAGLHEMYRDGWLEIHADYTKHYYLPMLRRLNLITYLNKDWEDSWGGELELHDYKDSNHKAVCTPYFNRTIIFPTTAQTLHGVPKKLSCPPNRSRKLISVYYWTPIPMPFLFKIGTPLIWASEQKKLFRKSLKNIQMLFHS